MSEIAVSNKLNRFLETLGVPDNKQQRESYDKLCERDFPTTKDEYWKYTRLGKISNSKFFLPSSQLEKIDLKNFILTKDYVLIENGIVREDLSQYKNANITINFYPANQIGAIHTPDFTQKNKSVFTALNSSYYDKVIDIQVRGRAEAPNTIQLIYVNHGKEVLANSKIVIEAAKSTESEIIETYISLNADGCFTNQVTDILLEENAKLTLTKIQSENETTLHVSDTNVKQELNSTFRINTISLGGLLVRNNINISVAGENCETYINGAIIAKGKQHIDNHTFVDHLVSNCYSNENYKYILDEKSTGVFNGRVVVEKDAQKINAYQNNGNILLSDNAAINSKPELEIYADDVKCSHGSTTGQLDEEAIFYLQSRGISKDNAVRILVSAFVGDVLDAIGNEKVQDLVYSILEKEHNWKDFS